MDKQIKRQMLRCLLQTEILVGTPGPGDPSAYNEEGQSGAWAGIWRGQKSTEGRRHSRGGVTQREHEGLRQRAELDKYLSTRQLSQEPAEPNKNWQGLGVDWPLIWKQVNKGNESKVKGKQVKLV